MKRILCAAALVLATGWASEAAKRPAPSDGAAGQISPELAAYFQAETARLSGHCLADIHSLSDWEARRGEYRRQLQEMLGLWPMPERSDLKPVITGKLEQEDFVVEKLYFEALPKLYVTANLYLPKNQEKPAPAILYVCGHSRVMTNGVSCGSKAAYQRHGAWFARNGYVCLTIDMLQYAEIQGTHRGTYSEGRWWWYSRGYTPAGVEAWFGIRALDYLCTRPEVDRERIGMTGRSGGGSYTWTVSALDDRVKVAAPIAGITDLQNQVVDGCIEGHCDCMFFVNTYRWDFPQVAALIAPRPLLIGNSDKDRIFPLDGVVRLYNKTRQIYALYGKTNQLGLLITEGPHEDTQDLQLPVFRWFNRYLKGEDPLIEMAARNFFSPEQLRVFDKLPEDQINTRIDETFVPAAASAAKASTPAEAKQLRDEYLKELQANVFAGWPEAAQPPKLIPAGKWTDSGLQIRAFTLSALPHTRPWLILVEDAKVKRPQKLLLNILAPQSWTNAPSHWLWLGHGTPADVAILRQDLQKRQLAAAFFAPRGVVPGSWPGDVKKSNQLRRRYMLLGQTLDSLRVWDIRCAAQALTALPEFQRTPLLVKAKHQMSVNAAYAALFEPRVHRLKLEDVPTTQATVPDYLNVLKIGNLHRLWDILGERAEISAP